MSHSTAKPPSARPRFNHRPSSLALGTTAGSGTRGSLDIPSTIDSERSSNDSSPVLSNDRQRASSPTGIASPDKPVSGTSSPASSLAQPKPKKKSKFSLSGLMGALDVSGGSSKNESHEHLLTPEEVLAAEQAATLKRQANDASYQPNPNVEKELGPWRFSDEAVDPAEVNSNLCQSFSRSEQLKLTDAFLSSRCRPRISSSMILITREVSLSEGNTSALREGRTDETLSTILIREFRLVVLTRFDPRLYSDLPTIGSTPPRSLHHSPT